jgi:hypothetical protein
MKSTYSVELFAELFGTLPKTREPRPAPKPPESDVMVPRLSMAPEGQVVYHVVPRRQDSRWNVKKEGATRPSAVCDTKDEAVEQARGFAKNQPWSRLVVHRKDGTIADEFTYGTPRDPADTAADWTEEATENGQVQDY